MEFLGYILGDPEILIGILAFFAVIDVVFDLFSRGKRKWTYNITLIGMLVALYYITFQWSYVGNSLLADDFSRIFAFIYTVSTLLIVFSLEKNLVEVDRKGLLHALVLLSVSGAIVATSSYNLITIIVGWELSSIPIYALLALKRDDDISLEAATKFFIVGAVGSALMFFGLSLIYGATGQVDLQLIRISLNAVTNEQLLNYGILILIAGIGFKLSLFPFYVWVPDVIEAAPNMASAYILAVSKAMAFAVAMRIFYIGFSPVVSFWGPVFAILALITMTFGNLAALVQNKMKRMLAYSSIAHAGYIIMVLSFVGPLQLVAGSIFHIFTHSLMKIGAFALVLVVLDNFKTDLIDDYGDMISKSPAFTFLMSIDMLSMAGIPILLGFWSKYFLFLGIADVYWWLGLAAFLNSAMSLYYYARVIKVMVLDEPRIKEEKLNIRHHGFYLCLIAIVPLVILGVIPHLIYGYFEAAAKSILNF